MGSDFHACRGRLSNAKPACCVRRRRGLTWGLRPAHDLSDVRTIGTARGGLAAAMQRVTVVPAGQSPRRLDLFVTAQSARLTRAAAQRWIEGGLITVNDRRAKPAQRIRPGDVIACHVAERLGPDATLVEVRPHTGRMHQIRVHLASIGHAVLGDATYGAKPTDPALGRPMLHAAVLGFVHPSTGRYAELRAPLPPDMERAVTGRRAATAATSA